MIWAIGIPVAYVVGVVLMARYLYADFARATAAMTPEQRKAQACRDGTKPMITTFSIIWPCALILLCMLFVADNYGARIKALISNLRIHKIVTGAGDKIIAAHNAKEEGDRGREEREADSAA